MRSTRIATLAATALSLSAGVVLASPAAAAVAVNTFQGECVAVDGLAAWPDAPLRGVPAPIRLTAVVRGGSCSGTLNGRRVDGVPLRAHIDVTGEQSCSGGVAEGRGGFVIAGRAFTADVHYKRPGLTPVLQLDGDMGGRVVAAVRAVAEPEDVEPLMRRCAGEGIPSIGIFVERFSAPQPVSSPQPERSRPPKRFASSPERSRWRKPRRPR